MFINHIFYRRIMKLQVLVTENPRKFKNKRVKITKQGDKLDVRILEPEMNFSELMKYRTQHSGNFQKIYEGIRGEGYDFANLGISGVFTITIDGSDYVLAAKQKRLDIGDTAAKLISGYIDSKELTNPAKAMKRELSEEVLPVTAEGEVIRFREKGKYLLRPFSEQFRDYSRFISVKQPSKYELSDLEKSTILIEGERLEGNPRLYFQVTSNSAQLIFSYHLDQKKIDFRGLRVSIQHAEDKLNQEQGILETMIYPTGILLLKLRNNNLTDLIYNYSNGEFVPVNPRRINLSEAFAQKNEGIVEARNITLMDYLKR